MRKVPIRLGSEELRRYYDKNVLKLHFPNEGKLMLMDYLYWDQELSIREISVILGCSQSTVRRRMKKHGIKTRSLAEAASLDHGVCIPEAELRCLYKDKELSIAKCAEMFCCDEETVRNKMREYDIRARSNAEALIIAHGYAHERKDFDGDEGEKAYYIGFCKGDCHADMCNDKGSQTIIVKCGSTAPEQIELFGKLFKPFGHVSKRGPYENGMVDITVSLNMTFTQKRAQT